MNERIPTAYELYFQGAATPRAERDALERRFFQTVGLPNGTWKTTARRRLDDLNELVLQFLPPQRPLQVMDVAVSSGISTLEWLESLEAAGVDCRMTAGDAAVNAYLISPMNGLRALVDRNGHVLQYEVNGRALLPSRKRHVFGSLPSVVLLRACAWLLAGSFDQSGDSNGTGKRWGIRWRPVRLVSPTLPERIEVSEDDILTNESYRECFDVLRAANILNLGYFDPPTLQRMLRNLYRRLKPGGLLVVCRTNRQGENHGTIFKISSSMRCEVVARLGAGSEIESLALDLYREA